MNNSSIICAEIKSNPFKFLFLNHLESADIKGIAAKSKTIQDFITALESLEESAENQSTFLHWSGIFSVFSSAGVLSGLTVINPILGAIASVGAVTSAVGVITLALTQNQERKAVTSSLRRYRIALNSDSTVNWGAIWELTGIDLFTDAMHRAADGIVGSDNRSLIRGDGKNPMAAALDCVSQRWGWSRDQLIAQLQLAKKGMAVSVPVIQSAPTVLQIAPSIQSAPTVLQSAPTQLEPCLDLRQTSLEVLDKLVRESDTSKLGGCILLAAPGGGKTTFLGTAWGRLKQKHGANFKSLAVIVKQSDVQAFKGLSDNCLCVKDSPVGAAIAIIRFIREGMSHNGNIKRLFLDDFLTMSQYFDGSLTGMFINPTTYAVYMDGKDKKDAEDFDAISLSKCLFTSLNELWLVGREYNACLWVSSHSPNVEALPFVGSRDSRSVGDLIFLAKDTKREFIDQALNNPNLIADNNKRQELKTTLANNGSDSEPWLLANFNNWSLGIVSTSVHEEYLGHRQRWEAPTDIERLERSLVLDYTATTDKVVIPNNIEDEICLSPQAQAITKWLQENRKGKVIKYASRSRDQSFINLARKYGYVSTQSIIDDLIDELLISSIITHDAEDTSIRLV